ncbi:MAG TPA: AraC family transcriptional regulator [Methylomirabilota bacterium]|nr:AraC family transcriptional regulator [Methylomirabilota bacterium]
MSVTAGGLPGVTLRRVVEHIDANVHRAPRLTELSAIAHMSMFHFARLFKSSTGLTPHRFVLRQRIEHAKRRLAGGDGSVAAVGRDAGFRNPSHFTNAFHRVTGVTPSEYRARHAMAAEVPAAPGAEQP